MVNIGGIEGPAGPVNAIPLQESVCSMLDHFLVQTTPTNHSSQAKFLSGVRLAF